MISPSGFLNASKRFEQLRSIAREVTAENLSEIYRDYASIRLAGIDSEALRCSEIWLDHECSRPRAEWSWSEAAKIYRQRHPKRFELSIWYDDKLCGLSYGRPSYASTRMRIELIEGAPRAGNPLAQGE